MVVAELLAAGVRCFRVAVSLCTLSRLKHFACDVTSPCRKALVARSAADAELTKLKTKSDAPSSDAVAAAEKKLVSTRKAFGKLHGFSMIFNFVVVAVLLGHLYVVAPTFLKSPAGKPNGK